ncbi:MAG TPA: manganese efflux pump MntP family protein, partial [Candidatus Goldiibacteriota bacterium]|nr:manganese efflux pump MntP family protein [Candidatus Goldiibacteriota bacterium]
FRDIKIIQALKMAFFFGGFQTGMALLGWLAGAQVIRFIEKFDHWVAFGLLLAVGLHMIKEGLEKGDACDEKCEKNPFDTRVLFVLAVATSIDSLAVGLGLAFVAAAVVTAALFIGLASFTMSLAGVYAGRKIGGLLGKKVDILGGIILVGIGVKILAEHLG